MQGKCMFSGPCEIRNEDVDLCLRLGLGQVGDWHSFSISCAENFTLCFPSQSDWGKPSNFKLVLSVAKTNVLRGKGIDKEDVLQHRK